MPGTALKNTRHERFAHELASGKSIEKSYAAAGFKPHSGNAWRLSVKESVRARVQEIQASAAERAEITQAQVLRELAKIGFSDLRKAVKWGPAQTTAVDGEDGLPTVVSGGVTLVESTELDDDTAAAIAEVSQTANGVKIKLHDKRAALVDIGKHLGMFKDDPAKGGDIHIHFDDLIKGLL